MEKKEITVKELIEGINKLMKEKNSKSQEQSDVLEKSYNERLEKMKEPDWEEKRRKELMESNPDEFVFYLERGRSRTIATGRLGAIDFQIELEKQLFKKIKE